MKIAKKKTSNRFRDPNDYTSIYMTHRHEPITDIKQIRKYSYDDVVLYYKGKPIGEGELSLFNKKKKYLHTEGVSLDKEYRQKGHGVFLYHHLISNAIRIGATRLYSSITLNNFSRRMWSEKLPKYYKVESQRTTKPCRECGSIHKRVLRYYIDLGKTE